MIIRLLVVLFVLVPLHAATAEQIIYVDDDATGADDGTSWENAYVYLQDALLDADSADKPVEIRIAQGVYRPDQGAGITPGNYEASFYLINDVALKGGYAGLGPPNPNARDFKLYETVLSGDLLGNDEAVARPWYLADGINRLDNSYSVLVATDVDNTAVLDGVVIRGGYANTFGYSSGAGMYNYYASPTLSNCVFEDNFAGIPDVVLGNGAGMYNYSSNPILQNCTFSRNCVGYSSGEPLFWSSVTGGGICNDFSDPKLAGCTFEGNVAFDGGGAISNLSSDPELTECSFNANVGFAIAGALYNYASNLTLANCTFSVNTAVYGGGIYSESSGARLRNCTFAGNVSLSSGDAVACDSYPEDPASNIVISGCILWDSGDQIWNGDSSDITTSYSNVEGDFPGEGNTDVDPCFAAPSYWDPNGTPEDPDDDSWIVGDCHLRSQAGRWDPVSQGWITDEVTSPCIDAGDPTSDWTAELWPHGKHINMGAFGGTAQASMSLSADGNPADCTGDGFVDARDLEMLCEDWLTDNLPTAADINRDGEIDLEDFAVMALHWLEEADL